MGDACLSIFVIGLLDHFNAFHHPVFTNYEFEEAPPPLFEHYSGRPAQNNPPLLLGCPDPPTTSWSDGPSSSLVPRVVPDVGQMTILTIIGHFSPIFKPSSFRSALPGATIPFSPRKVKRKILDACIVRVLRFYPPFRVNSALLDRWLGTSRSAQEGV